jgi:hypothetical protein
LVTAYPDHLRVVADLVCFGIHVLQVLDGFLGGCGIWAEQSVAGCRELFDGGFVGCVSLIPAGGGVLSATIYLNITPTSFKSYN